MFKTKGGSSVLDPRFNACILVSKYGSISSAANYLYLSKQAVKKQIDSLENELGITLFKRTNKGLELTPAGKMYTEGIERLTNQHSQLINICVSKGKTNPQLNLTIMQPSHPKLYFKEALLQYNALYPHVHLDIINPRRIFGVFNNTARFLSIVDGTVDVAFSPYDEEYNKELSYIKLCDLPYYCVVKPGHPLSGKQKINREDLASSSILINSIVDRVLYEHIVSQDTLYLPEQIALAENIPFSIPEVVSFCLNGGIYITKGDYIDTLSPMIAIPFDPPFSVENGLYYRSDAPAHIKAFVDLVSSRPWDYSTSPQE